MRQAHGVNSCDWYFIIQCVCITHYQAQLLLRDESSESDRTNTHSRRRTRTCYSNPQTILTEIRVAKTVDYTAERGFPRGFVVCPVNCPLNIWFNFFLSLRGTPFVQLPWQQKLIALVTEVRCSVFMEIDLDMSGICLGEKEVVYLETSGLRH